MSVMSGELSFHITLSELEQGEVLGCGFNVGEVWDAADFGDAETRNKIEGEWTRLDVSLSGVARRQRDLLTNLIEID